MASWQFTDEEINDFFVKLDTFAETLSEKEHVLLRAILHTAAALPAGETTDETRSFADEFSSAFQQKHAESIVAAFSTDDLPSASGIVKFSPNFIVR